MKRSTRIIAGVWLGIMGAAPRAQAEADRLCTPPAAAFDIAGSWVGSSPAIPGLYEVPLVSHESVTPTDSSGLRFTAVPLAVNGEATFGGLFPDADRHVGAIGTYLRSGPRTYEFTWLAYFAKSPPPGVFDRAEILYFWTLNGTVELKDANTRDLNGTLSLYSNVDRPGLVVPPLGIYGVHDQDVDDDGFADEGEVPFVSLPWGLTMKRFPPVAPCTPPKP